MTRARYGKSRDYRPPNRWARATSLAMKKLGIKGFPGMHRDTKLYELTKKIYKKLVEKET